jgi:hypothetical protein
MSSTETPVISFDAERQKALRRKNALQDLDGRRGMISADPAVREITKDVRAVVEAMKKDYSDVVGIGLFGSLVKGYAHPSSDVDAFLFMDFEKSSSATSDESGVRVISPSIRGKFLMDEFTRRIKARGRVIDHVFLGRADHSFLESVLSRPSEYSAKYLARFFMISSGTDILPYREFILDRLVELKDKGDYLFLAMMDELSRFENTGFPEEVMKERRKLYPVTLEAARVFFLALKPVSRTGADDLKNEA